MTAKAVRPHGQRTCAVEVSASEVDAGAELMLTAFVSCPHGCDLTGQRVSIRNPDGAELASAELTASDGAARVMGALVLRAPLEAGEHIYRAVLAAAEKDGVAHEETATAFSFVTKAHATRVNVWGLPSAIAAGERFGFKVGIKCSAGCPLTGRALRIFHHDGALVGSARLLYDILPGTPALFFFRGEAPSPPPTRGSAWGNPETP